MGKVANLLMKLVLLAVEVHYVLEAVKELARRHMPDVELQGHKDVILAVDQRLLCDMFNSGLILEEIDH